MVKNVVTVVLSLNTSFVKNGHAPTTLAFNPLGNFHVFFIMTPPPWTFGELVHHFGNFRRRPQKIKTTSEMKTTFAFEMKKISTIKTPSKVGRTSKYLFWSWLPRMCLLVSTLVSAVIMHGVAQTAVFGLSCTF